MAHDNRSEAAFAPQSWHAIEEAYESTYPFNYTVIDNLLEDNACRQLRTDLLNHWGWRKKNWVSDHLYTSRPDLPLSEDISNGLRSRCPRILENKRVIDFWGIMYPSNSSVIARHSDVGAVALTLWLTPDCHNQSPGSGGLVLFDIKRDKNQPCEHASTELFDEYFQQHTRGLTRRIAYGYNRAVLFDARTFHQPDAFSFSNQSSDSFRLNLSIAFDFDNSGISAGNL
jgi:hypothetical protein